MLIYLYIASLVLGGVLLGGSILLGGKDLDHGGGDHGGGDAHAGDTGDGHDADDAEGSHGDATGYLTLFLSLRFWTFFLAFFGLTGLVLDGLDLVPWLVALPLALALGGGVGYGAAWAMRALMRDEANSSVGLSDYVGKTARVLVPIAKGTTGKVRVQIKGSTLDVLATTDDEAPISAREEVLVVEVDGTVARVARVAALPKGDDAA